MEDEIRVLGDTIQGLLDRIDRLERSSVGSEGMPRCTANNPHDALVWHGVAQGYTCRCGMKYRKDGLGGLREVD